MWPDDYNDSWRQCNKEYSKKWDIKDNYIYDQLVKQLKNSGIEDALKTTEEISREDAYRHYDAKKHEERMIRHYITQEILSNDIFDDLDEATQAKARLLLGDVYIIPKSSV